MNRTSDIQHQTSTQPQLSIIVPIYNVAPYLRKCVDSLLAQDIADYEIILINDGSTDDSGMIADELTVLSNCITASSPTIKVIHQQNMGLSEARNTGTCAAVGKYIMYVDSDDYLQPNVLGSLLQHIERDNLDILRFRYQNIKESGEVFYPYKDKTNFNDYSPIPTNGLIFLNERMGNQCYAWQFILKRDIALSELFTPGMYFEDTDWTPRVLLQASRVASVDMIVYNYLWREGSITLSQKNMQKLRKQLEDKLDLLEKLNMWGNQVADRRWFDGMISGLMVNIVGIVASTFFKERKKYLQQIKNMQLLPIATYHIASLAQKKVRLINMSIDLAVLILHLKNK